MEFRRYGFEPFVLFLNHGESQQFVDAIAGGRNRRRFAGFLLNFFRFILVVRCGRALELDHFHLQRCLGLPRRDIN